MDRFITKAAPADEVENIALPADCGMKPMELVKNESLMTTLKDAYTYVKNVVPITPLYVSGPPHTKASLKEKMDKGDDGSVTASGTLIDLNLDVDAVSTLDVARIQWMLTQHTHARPFKDAIGLITVNWDTTDSNCSQGQRLDKDAEIQALCLLIYWTKSKAFIDMAADLVIKYVHAGLGSSSKAYTLRLINKEEDKRKARINDVELKKNIRSAHSAWSWSVLVGGGRFGGM